MSFCLKTTIRPYGPLRLTRQGAVVTFGCALLILLACFLDAVRPGHKPDA